MATPRRLAQLLDPTRLGSPLHQFRAEVSDGFEKISERLTAIEAAGAARASERAKSSAKGADFEDLIESLVADALRGTDHLVERTADAAGDMMRSKKGDFVITLDPATVRGATLRLVLECKDRTVSGRAMRDELTEARRNRDAAVGLVVFTPAHAPDWHRSVRCAPGRCLLRHRPSGPGTGDAGGGTYGWHACWPWRRFATRVPTST